MSKLSRQTRESEVRVALSARNGEAVAAGAPPIHTGDAFLDHMLTTLARYAGLALEVEASADLRHHLVEDVAITVGLALQEEIGPGCARYGEATVPMDDALVHAALDAGGRFYYQGPLPSSLYDHFLRSLAENARLTLHVRVLRGRDRHHIVEAAFKAVGLALRQALARESTGDAGHGDGTAATAATASGAGQAGGGGGGVDYATTADAATAATIATTGTTGITADAATEATIATTATAEDDATTAGGGRASNVVGERVFSTKGSVRIERQESPPEHPATRTGRGGSRPERPAASNAREGSQPKRPATPSAREGSRPEHPTTRTEGDR